MTVDAFTVPPWFLYVAVGLVAFLLGKGNLPFPLPGPGPGPADPKNPNPLNTILELLLRLLTGGGRIQLHSEPAVAAIRETGLPVESDLVREVRALRDEVVALRFVQNSGK